MVVQITFALALHRDNALTVKMLDQSGGTQVHQFLLEFRSYTVKRIRPSLLQALQMHQFILSYEVRDEKAQQLDVLPLLRLFNFDPLNLPIDFRLQ